MPGICLLENAVQNSPAAWKKGAAMATQSDPSRHSGKSKATSDPQTGRNAQPEIVSRTVTKVSRFNPELLTDEQRRELIATAAYYLAEKRNFEPGHEAEDWMEAESQIGSLGARIS
jgi:hypothetical protein